MKGKPFEVYDLVVVVGLIAFLFNFFSFLLLHKRPTMMGEIACVFHKALALIDMLTGVSNMAFAVRFVAADFTFLLMIFTMSTLSFTLSSVMLLTLICVDRYIAIKSPLRHLVFFSTTKAKMCVVLVVTLSCAFAVPQTYFTHAGGKKVRLTTMEETTETEASVKQVVFIVTAIVVIATVGSQTAINILLLKTLVHYFRGQQKMPSIRRSVSNQMLQTSLRGARTVLVMTAAFYIVSVPTTVSIGLRYFGIEVPISAVHAGFVVTQCNSLINPVIYIAMNTTFRNEALSYFGLKRFVSTSTDHDKKRRKESSTPMAVICQHQS
ncbi:Trace amine-associated receptor 7h [Holothuria leucospilota]|uniref:Trace amine-associated receptor 7h n=1 Tax=Holothuria leucospilota TaxID=206669 RepID=A0A9Q1BTA9_HOLLE|nr:Trace amine-associated receptor 7h [Holothuria leucospilota]